MRALTLIALLAAAGCSPSSDPDPFDISQCSTAGGHAALAGSWRIEGTGVRDGCSNDLLNTDRLVVETLPLTVTQEANGDLKLAPPTGLPAGATVTLRTDSRVNGDCMVFNLLEETRAADGSLDTVLWKFAGTSETSGTVNGSFEAEGPGTCRSEGTFRVTIE